MKSKAVLSLVAGVALGMIGAGSTLALSQQESTVEPMHHDMARMDMSGMMAEPHHVLAMAYMQNLGAFALALNHQADADRPLDAAFARSAVDEMKRSYDEMEKHHGEHMKTMSADMRSHMEAMMKEMETHRAMIKDALNALDKDVHVDHLDARKVSADSAVVLEHLDAMSKMHGDRKPMKM